MTKCASGWLREAHFVGTPKFEFRIEYWIEFEIEFGIIAGIEIGHGIEVGMEVVMEVVMEVRMSVGKVRIELGFMHHELSQKWLLAYVLLKDPLYINNDLKKQLWTELTTYKVLRTTFSKNIGLKNQFYPKCHHTYTPWFRSKMIISTLKMLWKGLLSINRDHTKKLWTV